MTTDRKQVALVTGGRSGIGQACARNLASQGIRVFTAQRQDDPEFDSVCADLADTDAPRQIIEHVTEHAGQLDILIN
ncbi:MAG: SDR family NAD(P)-dependent oxidoreductase, partial [Pseudomonadota bacterium]|nr:SDR family NAD(P)-dependent oxidoreductase [Pseudomonadota bacterium]